MTRASIAFVDDHPILINGLTWFFSSSDEFEIVGRGGCADDAVKLARKHQPDIILLDLHMPGDPFNAIREIVSTSSHTKLVAFTAMASVDCAVRALEAGANGFILKGITGEELTQAVRSVLAGENFITPSFATKVITALRNASRKAPPNVQMLSVREQQILELLLRGCTNKEIANALKISDKTVRYYMTLLMRKFKVRNRVEVVVAARSHGLH